MQSGAEDRYHEAVTALGARKRWYQTGNDLLYAAVVAGVDGVDVPEILARNKTLIGALPRNHGFHLVSQTVAAITAARGIDVESFIATSEAVSEELRAATRIARARRIAGAVVAAGPNIASGERVVTLHRKWNERHRLLTNALDLILAAITVAAGIEMDTALDRAESAAGQLADAGYRGEWEVARILALDTPMSSVPRFLGLADELRGRRRKPLTDRRHTIAIAALADHPPDALIDVMRYRIQAVRIGRFSPDTATAMTLAALLTLGESAAPGRGLRAAFHGFALREHYVAAYRDATTD